MILNASAITDLLALWVMFGNSLKLVQTFEWLQFEWIFWYHKTSSVNPQPYFTRLFLENTK